MSKWKGGFHYLVSGPAPPALGLRSVKHWIKCIIFEHPLWWICATFRNRV